LLDSNTNFTIISNKPLKIQAEFTLAEEGGDYSNIMNFSTGVLHFQRNYKEGNDNINATQVRSYYFKTQCISNSPRRPSVIASFHKIMPKF
jgi:hypothetical protein